MSYFYLKAQNQAGNQCKTFYIVQAVESLWDDQELMLFTVTPSVSVLQLISRISLKKFIAHALLRVSAPLISVQVS